MKTKADLITGILLFLVSIIALLFPVFKMTNIPFLLKFLFLTYSGINLGKFLANRKTKDFEGLFTFLISLFLFGCLYFIPLNCSSLVLSLFMFSFVILISFIHLKKADYYHDRKEKMWILEITTLVVFAIAGLLTSFSILLSSDGAFFMIGFLFFINGFIEIIDPIVNYIKK